MAEGPEVSLGQDAQAGRIGDAEGDADDLWQAGRLGEAAEAYRRLLERVPERLDLWQRAGRLSLLGNDLPSAVHRLAHALNNGLRSQSVWAALADAYYRKGELGSAAYCYERVGRLGLAGTLAAMAELEPYRIDPVAAADIPWLTDRPLPVVSATVNGKAANLVLDTGAGDLVLDSAFAVGASVPLGGQERRAFAGGRSATVTYGHVQALDLSDAMRVEDLPVQVLDLGHAFQAYFPDLPIHGIVGTSVLSRFIATLDYRNRRLLLEQGTTGRGDRRAGVPFWIAESQFLVAHAALPGSSDALMILDSGLAGAAFALSPDCARALRLEPLAGLPQEGVGGGGEVRGRAVRLHGLSFAGMQRRDVFGLILDGFPLERQFGFRVQGLVADEFLRDAVLTLDFPAMRMGLSAAAGGL